MFFKKLGNYEIFLFSSLFMSFASGLFAPFYFIFLQDFGGSIEQFGLSIGIMALAQSVTAYFSGKYSDKLGRKVFLIGGGFFSAAVVFAYALISSLTQLYALQVINGITNAVTGTVATIFLADVTKKASRGSDIGKYRALVGVFQALALMAGGYVLARLGYNVIFYITAAIIFVSTLILFSIKEKQQNR